MNFQSTVIIVATILLVVILIFIGYTVANSQNSTWPPFVGECPDYWVDTSGNGSQCVNVKDLGTCNGSLQPGQHLTMDFTGSTYTGSNGACAKYNWATQCGITWDGITDGVTPPCDTTSSSSSTSAASSPTLKIIVVIVLVLICVALARFVEKNGMGNQKQ
jgi:uncharacterized integral membrane protein